MALLQLTDWELMALVKNGDFSAFDELYRRYESPIRRFLFSLTWNQETAEDCLQEVFLRLYKARNKCEPTGNFSAFLYRIAKNYYLSERKKQRVNADDISLSTDSSDLLLCDLPINRKAEPEVHLLEGYRQWRIRKAIDSLPEPQKLVFIMSNLQEMKYADISEVLGIPVGTVKSRMFSAVKTLRSLLKEDKHEL